ncbi:hypothetical protein AGMMS4957_18350 [Bacteroidia bacterium]|nr:hypothetical protein AGMMS4957_18350 [Bacteroidia bacterium]
MVGFDKIDDEILKHLVVSRICQPRSKVATVDYLKSYYDEDSVEHTRRILGGKIGVVFYDVTTLYFETDTADELRKTGFSKDGKHACPQIVLGLLVSSGGYPSTATSRLIVGYSENRAKKDRYNREKGIKRLGKEYKSDVANHKTQGYRQTF